MRFRAEQHLRRQGDIRAVREQGRRVECRAFTIWWKRRDPADTSSAPAGLPGDASAKSGARVCVIASTAAVGHAVRRARAKRRLREVFRHQQHAVPPGCDLLLIARAAVVDLPLPELEKRFSDACRQIDPREPSPTS
jgi:ribonuclease P protein component